MVLRYFGIRVTELERSVKFYTELLGLRKRRQGKMQHGGKWILLEDPRSHQRLELNPDHGESDGSTLRSFAERLSDALSSSPRLRSD